MKALTVRATRLPYGSPEQRESDAESESMWRPTDFEDFTDGGAYPEIFAMQFPNGLLPPKTKKEGRLCTCCAGGILISTGNFSGNLALLISSTELQR